MEIDLSTLPEGERYEDRYGAWIRIFEQVAHQPPHVSVRIIGAPWSWVPLLDALGAGIVGARDHFEHCASVRAAWSNGPTDRTALEVLCGFRPETADALWKCDAQWKSDRVELLIRAASRQREFIVTTNSSFWRSAVTDYAKILNDYVPLKRRVVLVPCAADKPYPARLHKMVREVVTEDWYIATITGVLGIVPEALWPVMPHYDSGIPNEWRVQQAVQAYFVKHPHEKIVVFSDFYSVPIMNGLILADAYDEARFAVQPKFYPDYLPLHEKQYMRELEAALA